MRILEVTRFSLEQLSPRLFGWSHTRIFIARKNSTEKRLASKGEHIYGTHSGIGGRERGSGKEDEDGRLLVWAGGSGRCGEVPA